MFMALLVTYLSVTSSKNMLITFQKKLFSGISLIVKSFPAVKLCNLKFVCKVPCEDEMRLDVERAVAVLNSIKCIKKKITFKNM